MDLTFIIFSSLLGFVAAMSGGFWGLGGGWLIVPSLMLMGKGQPVAAAASLMQMIPAALLPVCRQLPKMGWKEKGWGRNVALPLCSGIFIGGFFGRPVGDWIEIFFDRGRQPHQLLYIILLLFILWRTVSAKEGQGSDLQETQPQPVLTAIAGIFNGVISSLLGIGGGTVNRPLLRSVLKVPEANTGQICRLAVLVTAVSGTVGYAVGNDQIMESFTIACGISLGGFLGFPLGVKMHQIVVDAGKGELAHRSFALVVSIVLAGMVCKVAGWILAAQILLLISGLTLAGFLTFITISAKKRKLTE